MFQIGWGDCFVACDGMHFWRVHVSPTASSLIDEWGDAIPADVLTQWRQPQPDR